MAFDGFVMNNIIKELNTSILDSKVNKIFSPTKNDIIFNLYNCGNTFNLLINASAENCRICLSNSTKKNPTTPSNFCMLLRKHLTGSRIIAFNTFGLERVVEILFECYSDSTGIVTKKIVAEIMNRYSNIILTDFDNSIIGSLKYTGKSIYTLPISNKYDFLDVSSFDEFFEILSKNSSSDLISKILNSFNGTSKSLIFYILEKYNIDSNNFSKEDLLSVYEYLKKLSTSDLFNLDFEKFNLGKKEDFSLDITDIKTQPLSLNYFIDSFYFEKENSENFFNKKYSLEKIINTNLKKCNKKLENIENKLEDCNNMDTYKIYGELLNSNLYKISDLRSNFVELENYYENNNLIKIPLDISITVKKNAEKYFKKYRKLKNASKIIIDQKNDALKEHSYLEAILFSTTIAKTLDDLSEIESEISDSLCSKSQKKKNNKKINKKNSTNSFNLEKLEIDGYTIFIGKNNRQNEYLTLKFASRADLWFHVQGLPGSHIVLKTNNLEINDDIIYKCASLAKQFSKASDSLHVSVDYTQIKNIRKSPSGKPGMVIYSTYKTIII